MRLQIVLFALVLLLTGRSATQQVFDNHVHLWEGEKSLRAYEEPTGYKVVRVKLDDKGQPQGGAEDFITGWLAPRESKKGRWIPINLPGTMGRPVGIVFSGDGTMYLSDDRADVIYRVTYSR